VRIAFVIRVLVMDAMGRDPEDRSSLQREGGAPGQHVFNPLVGPVTAVGQQPVIRHPDAQHAGDHVEDESSEDGAGVYEEEGRDRPDMKAGHRGCRNPVQSLLVFPSVLQSRHCHRCTPSTRRAGRARPTTLAADGGTERNTSVKGAAVPLPSLILAILAILAMP
jgi:hypothetical protein